MSEQTSHLLSLNDPALAPLRRTDLASFAVLLPDARVLMATPPCAALGIVEDALAPMSVKVVARHLAATAPFGARLERVRLPSAFVPRVFSCACLSLPVGRAVVFADPLALAQVPGTPAGETPVSDTPPVAPEDPGRPVRFTWEVDAEGRLSALSASLIEALAPRLRAWHGRSFPDLVDDGVLKDATSVIDLMHTGATFSEAVVWTADIPSRRMEMGGVPLLDGAKRRIGFRGFGLIWAAPPRPPEAQEEPPQNVVPLRGGSLSARERSAFHEIARTLNEAIDAWPKGEKPEASPPLLPPSPVVPASPPVAPAPPPRPVAEATSPPLQPPERTLDEGLLDRLPIGIAIQQRGVLAYVNASLLAWAGCADAEAFRSAGGLSARLIREMPDAPLELQSLDGQRQSVDVRLISATWRGQPAIVHVVRVIERPALAPAPAPAPAVVDVPPPVPPVDVAAERARARAEALDLIPFPIFLLGRNGAIEHLNAAAADLSGFGGNELQGEPFTLIFAIESQKAVVELLDRACDGSAGGGESQALTVRHRLGAEFGMQGTLVRAGEEPPRFCLVLRPLSAAETAPPALAVETSVSEGADPSLQVRDEPALDIEPFVRRVSHAVRTPLTGIMGFVEAVRSAAFGPVGNRLYAKHAEAAATAAQQLLASLEDIEHLFPAPAEEGHERVDVDAVLASAVDHVTPSARRRRVLIRKDVASPLEARFNNPVLARAVRLLLEEAVRATPAGGQVIVSAAHDAQAAEDIVILVRDGGAGLTEEEIAQALSALRGAPISDRFISAGVPFRMARIAALLNANGARLELRRGVDQGMLCEIRIPA